MLTSTETTRSSTEYFPGKGITQNKQTVIVAYFHKLIVGGNSSPARDAALGHLALDTASLLGYTLWFYYLCKYVYGRLHICDWTKGSDTTLLMFYFLFFQTRNCLLHTHATCQISLFKPIFCKVITLCKVIILNNVSLIIWNNYNLVGNMYLLTPRQ